MYNVKYNQKIVVITGAASGIGAEFVSYFSKQKSKIALLDMSLEGMQSLVDDLQIPKENYMLVKVDITFEEEVKNAFKNITQKFNAIDILINNAGISQICRFDKTDLNIFKKVIDVNFYGTVYCTKYALPYLQKSKGQIIALSSVAGFSPLYGRTAYAASKHALQGFLNSLQTEVRSEGVKVLLACPSFVKTNIEDRTFNGQGKLFGKKKGIAGKVMTTDYVVAQIMQGVEKGKNIIYISRLSKMSHLVNFFFPKYFEKKMVESVQEDFS